MECILEEPLVARFGMLLMQEERSPATVEKYLRDVCSFRAFAGQRPVCKELVVRYKQYLVARYAPASVNSMLAAVNRFLRSMGWYGCTVKPLKIQRETFRPRERELTKEEYFRLLNAANRAGKERLALLMQTLCATGIRVSELRFITVEAVCTGVATVSLKGKTRKVLLPKVLCNKLRKYACSRGIKSGPVFLSRRGNPLDRSNILHEMKALCEAAGVDRRKVFPHNLRHLFAVLYYAAQKDLSHLADLLGHSSINTTRIYTCTSIKAQLSVINRLGLVI